MVRNVYSSLWFWEDLSSDQLDHMVHSLPPFRKSKVLSYAFERDRVLCAKSYLMLCDILKEHYGILEQPEFEIGPKGKPYLKGIDCCFNLSHCSKGILCAVSDDEVGCDIEEIFPSLDMGLCKACCNEAEIDLILSSRNPNLEFTRLWTRKESYLKLSGRGLIDSMPDVLSESVLSCVSFETAIYAGQGCISTIATYNATLGNVSCVVV